MEFEYLVLAATTLFYYLAWLPSSVGKYHSFGGKWLASNRVPIPGKELLPWAARAERAYQNLKDYFPAFVVAILVLGIKGKFDSVTQICSLLFFLGRILHMISYIAGNINFRFIAFFISFISCLILLIKIFL